MSSMQYSVAFFFFQAEDGIRDYKVTGVQTCALPISTIAVVAGVIVTSATRAVTRSAAAPVCPSLVARIVTEPAAVPVTRPVIETPAIAASLVVQLTVRFMSGLPAASLG